MTALMVLAVVMVAAWRVTRWLGADQGDPALARRLRREERAEIEEMRAQAPPKASGPRSDAGAYVRTVDGRRG